MCAAMMSSVSLAFIGVAANSSTNITNHRCCYCLHMRDNKAASLEHPTTATITTTMPRLLLLRRPPKRWEWTKSIQSKTLSTTIVLDILRLMDALQLSVPPYIYSSLLKECTDSRDAVRGAEVHAHIVNCSGCSLGLHLSNRLLLMYARCGHLESAQKLFDKMIIKDSISWTTMIASHVNHGYHNEALSVFQQMLQSGGQLEQLVDNQYYFAKLICNLSCALKACIPFHTSKFGLVVGKQLHGWLLKMGVQITNGSDDLLLGSCLVNFYGKFGCLESAQRVFDQMHHRDNVVWTTMIAMYCRQEHFDKVLEVFKEMGRARKMKNKFTFSSVLRACGRVRDGGGCGRQVHANAIKCGVESDVFVQSSLVDMYGRSGVVDDARKAFEIVCNHKNTVCWNAMLHVYTYNGLYKEAIQFLYQMKAIGLQPQESNEVRIRTVCACGGLSDT